MDSRLALYSIHSLCINEYFRMNGYISDLQIFNSKINPWVFFTSHIYSSPTFLAQKFIFSLNSRQN